MDVSKLDAAITKLGMAHARMDMLTRRDAEFNEANHPRDEDGKFGSGSGGTSGHNWSKYNLAHTNAHKISHGGQVSSSIEEGGRQLKALVEAHPETAAEFAKAMESSDNPKKQLSAVNKVYKTLMWESNDSAHKPGWIEPISKTIKQHLKSQTEAPETSTNAERVNRYLSQKFIGPIKRG